jgi:hypothetical protein
MDARQFRDGLRWLDEAILAQKIERLGRKILPKQMMDISFIHIKAYNGEGYSGGVIL